MTVNKRDIGIDWLGEIPYNWSYCRFKDVVDLYVGNSIKDEDKDNYCDSFEARHYVSSKDIDLTFNSINYDTGLYIKKDDVSFKIAPKFSILMCIEGGSAGRKKAITLEDVCFVNKLCCFVPKNKNLNHEYLFYFLSSPNYEDYFFSQMTGMIGGVSISKLMNFNILLPPIDEQIRISKFLNKQINIINNAIKETLALIENYKDYKQSLISEVITTGLDNNIQMKDSNIDWIGEIPIDWSIIKAKFLFNQRNQKGNNIKLQLLSSTQKFGVIPQDLYEELSDMVAVKVKEDTDLSSFKCIHKNDYCISLRSFEGGFEYCEYEGVVSPAYSVFYPNVTISHDYYKYLFKEYGFIENMKSYCMSLRDGKNISFEDFGNTYLPYPPLQVQHEISGYLNERCEIIDSLIIEKEKLIDRLEEYKQSLIFEYVTGKKEVPNEI